MSKTLLRHTLIKKQIDIFVDFLIQIWQKTLIKYEMVKLKNYDSGILYVIFNISYQYNITQI